jgi:hypothetical protein
MQEFKVLYIKKQHANSPSVLTIGKTVMWSLGLQTVLRTKSSWELTTNDLHQKWDWSEVLSNQGYFLSLSDSDYDTNFLYDNTIHTNFLKCNIPTPAHWVLHADCPVG